MFVELPETFLDDFGLPCRRGGVDFVALLDMPDQTFDLGGGTTLQSTEYSLTYHTSDVTLYKGDAIIVGGVAYTVRDSDNKIDDGFFSQAKLTKP